ncbi:acyl carrier protein phosphodiesterase [Shewanella fidelis]|uniref:ACP phosphodiesterase n=1 Tax=Shewanella fidelis TaxID=173509 RepID=A0AAW8NN88_9GAMM|nr:ACP phosphodiesterase [Shewanella fidelis]MDR8524362.1 ACP phosphodiesterase [Shewanella fidelis]MDW4813429.1 ACP phosphodiesterase [Shewanella fidelis]MDW4817648.1 ACP phosphodiesterase [Shewanella fidelis]MDW4821715.1 ACP phosphodiesterase [Shewanella fidelis]MDW4825880.1 ACP phosphodiesterase [Shewanella fidelis]
MNFLAHLHLADNSQTSMAANIAGDFAKGSIEDFPKHLQQGLWLHRQIDQLTDSHEITKELLSLFPKSLTRAAPIIIDLSFDHMLAKFWDEYHHQTLEEFAIKAYDAIDNCEALPEKLVSIAPRIRQENWLVAYQTREGLNQTLAAVAKRVSKPEIFDGAQECVKKLDTDIEIAFRTFYPQLMAYSRLWTRNTPAEYL